MNARILALAAPMYGIIRRNKEDTVLMRAECPNGHVEYFEPIYIQQQPNGSLEHVFTESPPCSTCQQAFTYHRGYIPDSAHELAEFLARKADSESQLP